MCVLNHEESHPHIKPHLQLAQLHLKADNDYHGRIHWSVGRVSTRPFFGRISMNIQYQLRNLPSCEVSFLMYSVLRIYRPQLSSTRSLLTHFFPKPGHNVSVLYLWRLRCHTHNWVMNIHKGNYSRFYACLSLNRTTSKLVATAMIIKEKRRDPRMECFLCTMVLCQDFDICTAPRNT